MVLGEALSPVTWLALYALIGSLVGLSLAWDKKFTRTNQIVGAIVWPVTIGSFFYGFLRSTIWRKD